MPLEKFSPFGNLGRSVSARRKDALLLAMSKGLSGRGACGGGFGGSEKRGFAERSFEPFLPLSRSSDKAMEGEESFL
jgi:hypothetical protein